MITKALDPDKSIKRAKLERARAKWAIRTSGRDIFWSNATDRINIIRKGLPYEAIEALSEKANFPTKKIIGYLGLAQTTYNKRKRENELLSRRDTELILILSELLDFGLEVFNNEAEKFQRWLHKPNISLGDRRPESLFDSVTGIQEVRNALNRLEYGNMA